MRNIIWGIALLLFGLLLLLDNLGIADFGDVVGKFWPVILIVVGLLVLTRKGRPAPAIMSQPTSQTGAGPGASGQTAGTPPTSVGEIVDESFVFENIYRKVSSQNFKGGSISTVFGNSFIDLTGTTPAEGDHILRHHSVFGDSSILLSRDIPVAIQANTILGHFRILGQERGGFGSDFRVTTPNYAASPNRLTIVVSKVFGNVNVQQIG